MTITKAGLCDRLYVTKKSEKNKDIACIMIDGELVSLPKGFKINIDDCCTNGNNHLKLLCDDRECEDFAGRLEIAAAMGKQIMFFHARIDQNELQRVIDLIEAETPSWETTIPQLHSWTIYPYTCECNHNNKRERNKICFNLAKMITEK